MELEIEYDPKDIERDANYQAYLENFNDPDTFILKEAETQALDGIVTYASLDGGGIPKIKYNAKIISSEEFQE